MNNLKNENSVRSVRSVEAVRTETSGNGSNELSMRMENVSKSFGDLLILDKIDFSIKANEFVAIVGPSGCGKSTLLNIIAGYDHPTKGIFHKNGDSRTVFQKGGILPWLTIKENIFLAMKDSPQGQISKVDQKAREEEKAQQFQQLISLVGLEKFQDHFPHQISGGMRQKVEICRALLGERKTLLLDEPFSALDYISRMKVRFEFIKILQAFPRTVILVTHDLEEAVHLADRVVVLSQRPTAVIAEYVLNKPKPRQNTDPDLLNTINDILQKLNHENIKFH